MPDSHATSTRAGTFFDSKHRVLPVPGVSPLFEWLFEGDGAVHGTSISVSALQAGWRDAPANDPHRQEKVDSRTLLFYVKLSAISWRLLPNTPTFRGDHEHTTINAVTTLVLEMIVFLASSFIRRTLSTPYLAKLCVFRD